nr:immunoglobulin light chain junction region [Macaca mulatta]
LLSHSSGYTF